MDGTQGQSHRSAGVVARAALVAALVFVLAAFSVARSEGNAAQTTDDAAAAALFVKHCASCHGKDGRAKTFKAKFNKARDLTDAKWQAAATDERISDVIKLGRGKMPSFGKKLTAAQVQTLVAHVRGLKKE